MSDWVSEGGFVAEDEEDVNDRDGQHEDPMGAEG